MNINGSGSTDATLGKPNPRIVPHPDRANPVMAQAEDLTDSSNFMRLMIEQLKAQDPISPMKSNEFTQQLASLNSLQQLVSLNKAFNGMSSANGLANATALLGKYVEGFDSSLQAVVGIVERVDVIDGVPKLVVGDKLLETGQVYTVDDDAPEPSLEDLLGGGGA